MNNFEFILKINDEVFEFHGIEEDPLRYIMKLSDKSYLIRDINCDLPTEHWQIVTQHISIKNGEEIPVVRTKDVYRGREINDLNFLDTLLRQVLYGVVIPME